MSSERNMEAAAANDIAPGGGLQLEELGPEDLDGLLHANMLADFDFSYAELAAGTGVDAVQQQQQQQPLQQQLVSASPKLSGRKRSFTQACSWDNLGPKALSEISAGLIAGGGGWENGIAPLFAESSPAPPASSMVRSGGAGAAAATTTSKSPAGGNYKSRTGGACSKGRRGSGGEGKRPLNPDRMERKATREKRRREEVNQKFEQLLQVLEDAESTSGLEPPAAQDAKAAHACINGRRVEVLSRTIKVLKKLLQERRDSHAAGSCSSHLGEGLGGEEASRGPPLGTAHAGTEACRPLVAPGAGSAVSDSCGTDSASATFTAGDAAPGSFEAAGPLAHAAAEAAATEAEVAAAATAPAATAAAGVAAGGAANPAVVHHMAVPMSGHHASMIMPPGFAGMPGHGMPPGSHNMPGHPAQPFFIAVPMYMPQGQGVPPPPPVESAIQAPAAPAPSVPSVPAAAAAAAAARPAPSPAAVTVPTAAAEPKKEAVSAPPGKEAWPLASMGYHQSMMTLQMPQFVTQALSTEEGDESPTHAVCA